MPRSSRRATIPFAMTLAVIRSAAGRAVPDAQILAPGDHPLRDDHRGNTKRWWAGRRVRLACGPRRAARGVRPAGLLRRPADRAGVESDRAALPERRIQRDPRSRRRCEPGFEGASRGCCPSRDGRWSTATPSRARQVAAETSRVRAVHFGHRRRWPSFREGRPRPSRRSTPNHAFRQRRTRRSSGDHPWITPGSPEDRRPLGRLTGAGHSYYPEGHRWKEHDFGARIWAYEGAGPRGRELSAAVGERAPTLSRLRLPPNPRWSSAAPPGAAASRPRPLRGASQRRRAAPLPRGVAARRSR